MSKAKTSDDFIRDNVLIHGQKYNYKNVDYINNHTKVDIECFKHGLFKIRPNNHLSGKGCPKCGRENNTSNLERKHKALSKRDFSKRINDKIFLLPTFKKEIFAKVDSKYWILIKDYSWNVSKSGYVTTIISGIAVFLHKLIWSFENPDYAGFVDHCNRDKLDCRIENLRECTRSQNEMNKISKRNSSSQYKGVSFIKRNNKWRCQIKSGNQRISKTFNTEEEAAIEYNRLAKEYHGDFALLNVINPAHSTQRKL